MRLWLCTLCRPTYVDGRRDRVAHVLHGDAVQLPDDGSRAEQEEGDPEGATCPASSLLDVEDALHGRRVGESHHDLLHSFQSVRDRRVGRGAWPLIELYKHNASVYVIYLHVTVP